MGTGSAYSTKPGWPLSSTTGRPHGRPDLHAAVDVHGVDTLLDQVLRDLGGTATGAADHVDPAVLRGRLGQLAVAGDELTDGDVQRPCGMACLPLVVLPDVQQEVSVREISDLDRGHTNSETHTSDAT